MGLGERALCYSEQPSVSDFTFELSLSCLWTTADYRYLQLQKGKLAKGLGAGGCITLCVVSFMVIESCFVVFVASSSVLGNFPEVKFLGLE